MYQHNPKGFNEMQNPEKILIVRLSAVGDVTHVLPALRCLRHHYPHANITWLVEDRAAGLLEGHPDLDEVIIFPRKRWREGILGPIKLLNTASSVSGFLRELRAKRFDVAIDFHGNLKSGVMTFLSGAPIRIGFARGHCREYNHLFTNRHVTPPKDRMHRVKKYLSLLTALGIKPTYERSTISVPLEDRDYITKSLETFINRPGPLVVIHPGTSEFGSYKRWPAKSFAELGNMLVKELGAQVVVSWGPAELDMAKEIISGMNEGGHLAPKTGTLTQLASVIGQSDLFISGDTGPMHIASVLGVPQIAIFGPKDPVIYGPYNEHSTVVRKDADCSPCTKRTCDDPICITAITPDEVFVAAKDLLAKKVEVENN
ncbi:MAG: lipopolysaccharide heptosyltransferase II [Candidatus Brocadiales bacterium]